LKYFIPVLFLLASVVLIAQTLPDFSQIDLKSLSDTQLELFLTRAKSAGYSENQLLKLAQSQGLNTSELEIFNQRINSLKAKRVLERSSSPISSSRLRESYRDSLSIVREKKTDIFGLNIFRSNSFLTFEPNVNISIPKDYKIGPGDEIYLDIYGKSESYYEGVVSNEGKIILENVGPVSLLGLTPNQAEDRLKQKLSIIYEGILEVPQSTFVDFSLGNLRSISINVVGQVELPGTYTLSSLTTVYNALYAAGGISDNGTLRDIKVFRDSKLIQKVDIYDFLISGNSKSNVRLRNGDIILVGPFTERVSLAGAVKTPGIFELKENETIADLLSFAGGFAPDANTELLSINRVIENSKVIANVNENQFEIFSLKAGDAIIVDKVLDQYTNRVIVEGAVLNAGQYAITQNSSLKELLISKVILRPDAYLSTALISRTTANYNSELLSVDLTPILNGDEDFEIQPEDVITILSKEELSDEQYVTIDGEVKNPGTIPYFENLNLNDLILLAGGYRNSGSVQRIEIARRRSSDDNTENNLSDILVYNLDEIGKSEIPKILPFDEVYVRRNPNFRTQRTVRVEGEVKYPGKYVIQDENERISNLVERAGGVSSFAFIEGATLLRTTEFADEFSDVQKQINDLSNLRLRLNDSTKILSESELLLLSRIDEDLSKLSRIAESNQSLSNFTKRQRLKDILEKNSLLESSQLRTSEPIGINLMEVLKQPGSRSDLLLESDDVLIIPKRSETVRLRGKLLYPTTVRHEQSKSLRYYINMAGGFDIRAKKSGTYVVYANGDVARTRKFLFFKFYPKVKAGTDIIVPSKPIKIPVRIQDVVAITSGLATLVLVVNQITGN